MNDAPLVQLQQVSYSYADGPPVLVDINLELHKGAFVALVGPSGVGKSTLLRLIGGLLAPTGGSLRLAVDHSVSEAIGIVFQKDNLMPWRTAADNIRLPLDITGKTGPDTEQQLAEILELVGLTGFGNSYPHQLSGGMAQRVALARALVHHPSILLLDEPFGALDAFTREKMGLELLRIRQARPVTVFMVTHSIQEAIFLADRVLVIGHRPATITSRIQVPLPRPRQMRQQQERPFLHCVQTVRQAIEMLPG